MELEILNPHKSLFKGTVNLIQVPGTKGSFEILNNHAPIISTIEKGKIKVIDNNNKEHFFEINNNGFIDVKNNNIVVLVD